jgi:predicted nucleic acid-binding Zn ribbon protein
MARKSQKRGKPASRPCVGCGEVFQPRRHGQRSCSPRCRNIKWRLKHRTIRLTTESISNHEARLRAIESRLGITKGE